MNEERRRSPRFAAHGRARLEVGDTSSEGRLCDICRDAALVELDAPQTLGADVRLLVELPGTGDGEIAVSGTVIRVVQGDQGRHAAAVLFRGLPPAAAARIEFFLALQTGLDR